MSIIKKLIYKIPQSNLGIDKYIKLIEYGRGLYRYPKKMLGRNLSHHTSNKNSDVLVFAAHPDDEVLGVGTSLYHHKRKGENVTVVYVTNGTGGQGASWKLKTKVSQNVSDIRYKEGVKALSLIDISKENIFCLGYPDLGTHRYLKNIARDVLFLINTFNPKRIYVHCIEGGHSDHDITSFIVKSVCEKIGFTNVFEWAEYNHLQPLGTRNINFAASRSNRSQETIMDISDDEVNLKRNMLAYHESQGVVEHYMMGEAIRQADLLNLDDELLDYSNFPKRRFENILKGLSIFMAKKRFLEAKQYENKVYSIAFSQQDTE